MGDGGEVAKSHCVHRLRPRHGFVGLVALPPSTHALRLAGALEGAGLCDRRHRLFAERRLAGGVGLELPTRLINGAVVANSQNPNQPKGVLRQPASPADRHQ
jgi:hypothetical protein